LLIRDFSRFNKTENFDFSLFSIFLFSATLSNFIPSKKAIMLAYTCGSPENPCCSDVGGTCMTPSECEAKDGMCWGDLHQIVSHRRVAVALGRRRMSG